MKMRVVTAALFVAMTIGGIAGGAAVIDTVNDSHAVRINAGRTNVHSGGHGNRIRNGGNQTTTSCHCY